jgi:hypothetical protein
MQLLNEIAMFPVESEAESAAVSERLKEHAQKAILSLDIEECCRITRWANDNPHPAAGPALCAMLLRPNRFKGLKAWKREAWIDMRISAIRALAQNRDQFSAPTLAHVLVHDVPKVREEARIAIQSLGSTAVLPLVETIRVTTDWPIGGMLYAIETLGIISDKSAGPTLARILFGLLPNTPVRWMKAQFKWAAFLGAIETAMMWQIISSQNDGSPGPVVFIVIYATLLFLVFTSLSALAVGVFIRRGKSTEANRVNSAATKALICIKDPRSVPSLVEVATEKYSPSARAGATLALRETLPILTTSDYGLLTGAVERRLTSMFAVHNPSLTLATVRALEFVGTGQSVGPVERLARRKPLSNTAVHAEIKAEAERVLPVLVERKRSEEASTVLLRPSQVAADTGAVLLRPVSSLTAYEEPVDQLLRPGQAD